MCSGKTFIKETSKLIEIYLYTSSFPISTFKIFLINMYYT